MNARRVIILGLLVLVVGFFVTAAVVDKNPYSKFDARHYLTDEQIAFVRPGLDFEIQDISVDTDGTIRVTFTVTDDRGLPLDLDGVLTPGPISASFLLATIPNDGLTYESYIFRTQTSPITGDSADQPTSDSGGSFETVETGTYIYTYGTKLPADADRTSTHSVGVYSRRDLREFDLGRQVDNEVVNFIPDGGDVVNFREVVLTGTCNNCHGELALHGGARQAIELCVMCHYPGVVDPDTGNTVDMANMVHKIHRGANLPSVLDGIPYQIIGFRQSVHDYSTVHYPQDIRNCESCHSMDAAQANSFLLLPSRRTCGACHDGVNFASGEGHAGGPQISDMFCSNCHFPQGELEFDASIRGGHTIPYMSTQLEGINIEILDVTDTGPGMTPTVMFSLRSDDGTNIAPSSLAFFNFVMAGPTDDYNLTVSERAVEGSVPMGMDAYTYTFTAPIPDDAEGTFTMGAEAFRMVELNPGTTKAFMHRETAVNPVRYFAVTDEMAIPRRTIVADMNCDRCHGNLMLHGTIRQDPEYCVTCHRPDADDSPFRPEGETPRTIDFKFMIHRIHMGEELENEYTLVGFMGSLHNYNEVRYPNDRRDCTACHEGATYNVPSEGIEDTIAPSEFFTPLPPNTSACLGCHDDVDAASHAYTQISPFGESCGTCHGVGAAFEVPRVHSKP